MKAKISTIDDNLRFENFIDILPKEIVDRVINQLIQGRLTSELSASVFNAYSEFSNELLSEFSNPKIKDAQRDFNNSFEKLNIFQLANFSETRWGEYRLEPGLKENSVEWKNLKQQLDSLVKDFEEKYKKLIIVINDESAQKQDGVDIQKTIEQEIKKKEQLKIDFDSNKSIFYINEHSVKIQKFSDQYHLLRIVFEDRKELLREWFFSEIAEKYDEANASIPDKKFYNAVYQLNQKIAVETGVKNFFTKTMQTFQIDSKYTKNS